MKEKATKEYVNKTFPHCVAVANQFRQVFGPGVRMVYAKENEREIGRMRDAERPSVRLSETCIYGSFSSDETHKGVKRGKNRK